MPKGERRRLLARQRVLEIALYLIDQEGLEAFSMRKLMHRPLINRDWYRMNVKNYLEE